MQEEFYELELFLSQIRCSRLGRVKLHTVGHRVICIGYRVVLHGLNHISSSIQHKAICIHIQSQYIDAIVPTGKFVFLLSYGESERTMC